MQMTHAPSQGRPAAAIPEVSVGMPVYNGQRFLAATVESILAQTFTDFELIISDNASTDRTAEICGALAAQDARVRYIRQPRNIGAVRNWRFVADAARGPLFKWASSNDRCHPLLLEKCVEVLRRDSCAILCYGRTCLIDGDDRELGIYEYDFAFEQSTPSARFISVRNRMNLNNAFSGVIRLPTLRQAHFGLYPGGDMILMAELALYGTFVRLPNVLLYRRMDQGAASRFLGVRELREFLDPGTAHRGFTAWRRHWDCWRAVLRAPIPWREKRAALDFLARSVYWDSEELRRDLRMRDG